MRALLTSLLAAAIVTFINLIPAEARNARPSHETSRSCLTSKAKHVLDQIEAKFGRVHIDATCVKKKIAGTNRTSEHSYGKAVDFEVPPGKSKAAIVQYCFSITPGLVMTYASSSHIHFDVGAYHRIARGR